MHIPSIKLNNNTLMPQIGFGTWQLRGEKCIQAVNTALQMGYTHIDTAEMYLNESEIGTVLKKYDRKKLFITSKVAPDNLDYYKVLAACEESLARLETDYLDLYLIHWPTKTIDLPQALKAFKALYEEKKIKAFGVSNFTIHHLQDVLPLAKELKLPLSVNQVEFHPRLYQKDLLTFCNKHTISITAYSPLAMGMVFKDPVLKSIAATYKKTSGQISLRWLLDKNLVIIPKATTPEHIRQNLELDFKLSQEDTVRIDTINSQQRLINPSFADFEY